MASNPRGCPTENACHCSVSAPLTYERELRRPYSCCSHETTSTSRTQDLRSRAVAQWEGVAGISKIMGGRIVYWCHFHINKIYALAAGQEVGLAGQSSGVKNCATDQRRYHTFKTCSSFASRVEQFTEFCHCSYVQLPRSPNLMDMLYVGAMCVQSQIHPLECSLRGVWKM